MGKHHAGMASIVREWELQDNWPWVIAQFVGEKSLFQRPHHELQSPTNNPMRSSQNVTHSRPRSDPPISNLRESTLSINSGFSVSGMGAAAMLVTRRQVETFLIIGLGAVIGANLRYWVSGWAADHLGRIFPWGTLIINFSGSCVLAIFTGWATNHVTLDPRVRLLVAIGFCGGYTTFSTYANESVALLQAGDWIGVFSNILGTNLVCVVGALIGLAIGRQF